VVAAIGLVLVGGLNLRAGEGPGGRRLAALPAEAPLGSLSVRPDVTGPALAAVEIGRAPAVARPDGSQASRWLTTALLAVALLAAAARRRTPRLHGTLELAIRCRTAWWRPTPGGRAPPRLLTA
jgi:hypothetical protein